ncbi:hypothetical protein COY23_03645 [bacterium (Candidatus Torokbacteria) CG_4_10_14_0_2_um_filter_35_8]|nr:MAG: hypothetical protein COY23_03645 [bacterium (Candidatus Torokbacteria) CG_4_10_14_0_2_um_filter_35_8]
MEKINWRKVEELFEKGSEESLKFAIIEARKAFKKTFLEKRLPGKDVEKKIEASREFFTNADKLLYAERCYRNIIEESDFEIGKEDTEDILQAYFQGVYDLENTDFSGLKISYKVKLWADHLLPETKLLIRNIVIGTFLLLLSVIFFADTKIGQEITRIVVAIAHFVFSWVLVTILIIIAFVAILIGSIFYFEGRKNKNKITKIEER